MIAVQGLSAALLSFAAESAWDASGRGLLGPHDPVPATVVSVVSKLPMPDVSPGLLSCPWRFQHRFQR
jgi:hypothetical protein